jgi:hypothetical protein
VSAVVRNLFSEGLISEDQFLTQSECAEGGLIRIDLFSNSSGTRAIGCSYRLVGTEGVIEFPAWGKTIQVTRDNGENISRPVDADLAELDGFQRLHLLFRNAVSGAGPVPLSGETAALNLEWGLAAYISSEERRTIDLPLPPEMADFCGPIVPETVPATRQD